MADAGLEGNIQHEIMKVVVNNLQYPCFCVKY